MDWKSFAPSALSHAQKFLVSFIHSETFNQHSDLDILDPLSTDFGILRVASESPNKYNNFSPVEINNDISSIDQSYQNVKTHLKISNTYSNVDSQISSITKLSILNSNTNLYNICVNNNPIHNEICKKNTNNVDTSTMKISDNYDNYNDFTTPDSCDSIKINKRNLFRDEIIHSIPCDTTPIAYDDYIHYNDDTPGLTSFHSCQTHNSIENNLSDDILSENKNFNGSLTIIKSDLFEPIITEHDTGSLIKIEHLNEIFKMRENKILELSNSIANLHSINDSLKDQIEFLRNNMNISLANDDFDKDEKIKQLFDEGYRLSHNELLLNNIIKKLKQKNIESDIKISLQEKNNDEYEKKLQFVIEQCNELQKHNREYIHKINLLNKDVSSLSNEKIQYLSRITELELQLHNSEEKMSGLHHDSSYHVLEKKPFYQLLQQEQSETLADSPCSKYNSSASILEHELLNLRNYIYLQEQKSSFIADGFRQEIEELRNLNAQNVSFQHNFSDAISSSTLPLLKEIDELRLLNSDEVEKCSNLKSKFEMEISILENERNLAEEETKRLKIDKDSCKVINKDLDNTLSIQQSELRQTLQQLDVIKIQIKQCQIELKEKENKCSRLKQSYFEINNVFQEDFTKQYLIDNKFLIGSSLTNSNYKIQSINDSAIKIIPNFDHLKILPVLENSTNDILKIPISHSSFISNVESSTWSSASQLSRLQIIINIKDGQIEVLKMENSHLHKTLKLLSDELLQLLNSNQEKSNQVKNLATLKNKFQEVNIQYQTLLEMYGEKLEQNQELQFDLLEMKELYKIQTEELLNNMYSNIVNS